MDTLDEADLWSALRAGHVSGTQCREQLILRYTPLVRYVAWRVAARLADTVERQDLVSYGMFGLIDAIDRFDPGRGVKFESFATLRIQGAIIDELRALDWAPRSVRSRARWVATAREALQQRLHRRPTTAELAAELGWEPADVRAAEVDHEGSFITSLHEAGDDEDDLHPREQIEDITAEDPALAAEVEMTRLVLAQALAGLPDRERAIARLYWVEGLSLGEAGRLLGISESWACQLYTNAALALRERLAVLR